MANDVRLEEACKKVFGISSRRYRQWAAEGLVPPVVKGKIDFTKASKYIIEYYRRLAQGQGSQSLVEERARLAKINADTREIELKILRGDYVDVDRVEKIVFEKNRQARDVLHKITDRVFAILASKLKLNRKKFEIVRNVLDKEIRNVEVKISNGDFRTRGKSKQRMA